MSYNGRIMADSNSGTNRVRDRRIELNLTQAELADRAGISRSAVTAIEASRLIPSVAAALALSQAMRTSVEALFGEYAGVDSVPVWAWDPGPANARFWQAEVMGRTVNYPAISTPMLTPPPDGPVANSQSTMAPAGETLVLASCDPAAGLLASHYHAATGMRLLVIPRSSQQSIEMLKDGLVHLAGLHFSTEEAPNRNTELVGATLGNGFQMARLAQWQEGIAMAGTSALRSVRGVLNAKLIWVGRESGSGARRCLDELLQGRRTPRIEARNHQGVAQAVQSGWADAGVCVQMVSEEAGLKFFPVQQESYDVCFSTALAGDRRIKAFIKVIRSLAYRRLLSELPGYDASSTGDIWSVN